MQPVSQFERMERDSNRQRTFCSLNLSVCKQPPQDAALQEQKCICTLNKEASPNESEGDSMAPEGSDISASKESLLVVEELSQEAQISRSVTLGKRSFGEKAALEVTCVRQSNIRATQSGILDFLTVEDRKQDSKHKKLTKDISKGTRMQMKSEAELHRSTIIKKPLNEKEGISFASTLLLSTNPECEGYALKKEEDRNLSSLNLTGSSYDRNPKIIQNDFFLPASKKRELQKRQEAANVSFTDCTRASRRDIVDLRRCMPNDVKTAEASKSIILKQPSRNEDFFKPASKKQKHTMNKEVSTKLESITQAEVRDRKYFEFDFQMEAKLAAEENAQLCAGRPTHPFFSQCKTGSGACTFQDAFFTPAVSRVEDLAPASPLHINQLDKEADDQNASSTQSLSLREVRQPILKAEFLAKSMEILRNLLKRSSLSKPCKVTRLNLRSADHAKECLGVFSNLTSSSTAAGRNLLWIDAYQPQLPEQVCGNQKAVNYLSDWLQNWQIRCKSLAGCSEVDMLYRTVGHDKNCNEDEVWSEEDSDSGENTSNGYSQSNVLLLAGPVGCGKTAAIYASAKAHGYTVIEVNCSENRSGTLIKQKFREAMESHRVGKWSADATVFPLTKEHYSAESNASRVNTSAHKAINAELVDGNKNSRNVAANIHDDTSKSESPFRHTDLVSEARQLGENDEPSDKKGTTILLFEDADLVFEDDGGFMAAVAQIAEFAKRPIILTSNGKELCLPHNLCSHLLEFNRPSTEDLMALAYQVCIAEGVVCSPELLQKVVNVCDHDARKMLNYLQFWCQGKFWVKPQNTEIAWSMGLQESDHEAITYLYNLEAQHRLWPAYIDLDCPCNATKSISWKLSERVSEAETQHTVHEEKKLVQEIIKKRVLLDKMKKRMIDSPPSVGFNDPYEWEEKEITCETLTAKEVSCSAAPDKNYEEARAVVQSPVLKRKSRRQVAIIMSESDDDIPDATHEEHHHKDEQHLHLEPEPLSSFTSPRTAREMGFINVKNAPVSSDLHAKASTMYADTDKDAAQTKEIPDSKEVQLSTLKHPHEELVINQDSKEGYLSTSKCPHEELAVNQAAPFSFSNTLESVYSLWSNFRTCSKSIDDFLLSPASKESFSAVLSLSDLSDNLSACDIMSCVHHYKQDVKNETSMFLAHEDCDWVPVCAQVAQESFKMCLQDARKGAGFEHEDRGIISLKDMMLVLNDPFTIGTLATDEKRSHQGGTSLGWAGPSSEEQNQKRLQKKSSLQNEVFPELPLPAQRSFQGAAFYEHLSFLARMGHVEQDRLALGSTRLRARPSQSLFCNHPWDLSENSITILLSFGIFGKQGMVG